MLAPLRTKLLSLSAPLKPFRPKPSIAVVPSVEEIEKFLNLAKSLSVTPLIVTVSPESRPLIPTILPLLSLAVIR